MTITALITEYNPFHNGHLHHINLARRLTNADYVIAIMSGDYVQRGTPAIIDKYDRTLEALANGVDLVLELPICYSTASAEMFAFGAVSLIEQLNIVDNICFGCECNNINTLNQIVNVLSKEPESYKDNLDSYLRKGLSYPSAREKALLEYFSLNNCSEADNIADIISSPNNILAIEYLKTLKKLNSTINPIAIKRTGSYSSTALSEIECIHSSASAIRNSLESDKISEEIKNHLPSITYEHLCNNYNKTCPVVIDDYSLLLYYCLSGQTTKSLTQYMDVDEIIANKLLNNLSEFTCITEYLLKIKTRDITYSRLSRAVLHIILGLKKSQVDEYVHNDASYYARILGFKKSSSQVIKLIKNSSELTLINKIPDAYPKLNKSAANMLTADINATHLYNQIIYSKFQTKLCDEYRHDIVIH